MKKHVLTLCLLVASILSFAQEPDNNLGKSLNQIRQDFPNALNSRPAGRPYPHPLIEDLTL